MRYSTVIFDLDGTLLATLEDLHLAMVHTLAEFALPVCACEDTRARVGNGIKRLCELSVPGGSRYPRFEEFMLTFNAYYQQHCNDHTAPYPGVPKLLEQLQGAGCKIAVVSNKNHGPVCDLVHLHFGDIFDAVLGVQDGIARKPARDMVDAALQALGETPLVDATAVRAVYVGDSEVDLLTAANAELPCISVTWGFRTREQLLKAGATTLVDSAEELFAALQ